MAVVLGAILVVGWLALVYVSNQAYASRVTPPLQIIEVGGGGGGSPDGTRRLDREGRRRRRGGRGIRLEQRGEPGDFEEPSVQQAPGAMLDAVVRGRREHGRGGPRRRDAQRRTGRQRQAGVQARHRRARPGLRARRRRRLAASSAGASSSRRASPEEYARQLDALGVELAVVVPPNQLLYVSNFSSPQPTKRYGTGQERPPPLLPLARSGRKASDVALLKKAGIEVGENVVLQFYPAGSRSGSPARGQLSRAAAGRDPRHPLPGRAGGQRLRFQGHRPGSLRGKGRRVGVGDGDFRDRASGLFTEHCAAEHSDFPLTTWPTEHRTPNNGNSRSPRRSGSGPVHRAGAQPPDPVRDQPALRDRPRRARDQAGPRPDPLEAGRGQGRGVAGCRVRPDQRPQDGHRQHRPGREITVGPCRIFVLRMDGGRVAAGRAARGAAAEERPDAGRAAADPSRRLAGRDRPIRPPIDRAGSRSRYVRPGETARPRSPDRARQSGGERVGRPRRRGEPEAGGARRRA